ncbi:MAG: Dps family protein [Ginsengibacter sp.]
MSEEVTTKGAGKINQKVISKSKDGSDDKEADNLNTGITKENSRKVSEILNQLLADEFLLYTKTLNFHWNIEGSNFYSLHLFLDEQYNQLQTIIDQVAERIRNIGHFPKGSMKDFMQVASLKEHTGAAPVSEDMLQQLADDHDAIIRKARCLIYDFDDLYDDAGSADFITAIMKEHEKMSWMLRASIAKKGAE